MANRQNTTHYTQLCTSQQNRMQWQNHITAYLLPIQIPVFLPFLFLFTKSLHPLILRVKDTSWIYFLALFCFKKFHYFSPFHKYRPQFIFRAGLGSQLLEVGGGPSELEQGLRFWLRIFYNGQEQVENQGVFLSTQSISHQIKLPKNMDQASTIGRPRGKREASWGKICFRLSDGIRKMNRNANKFIVQFFHMPKHSIVIGYYPIRGKAQVCRLLCEYLKVSYSDRLFSIGEWQKQKKDKLKNHALKQLPYLQEGNFRIAGSIPMCFYIIDRFSNGDLLGKNLKDQALVDMYLWTIDAMSGIIKMNCQKKSEEEIRQLKDSQWRNVVAPKLQNYQQFATEGNWILGYLTIIDFSIYELVHYIELIFGDKIEEFPKLKSITKMVGELPEIKAYEESEKAVREMCPTALLKQVKQQQIKNQN